MVIGISINEGVESHWRDPFDSYAGTVIALEIITM